jgi:outer membrane protein assembly factor BamB
MMPRRLILAWLLCVAGEAGSGVAQEWARFRGPNGAGQSEATSIPVQWTAQDCLWQVALTGVGNSSPVVWDDRIYLLSADPKDGTRFVLCHSTVDGRLIWKQDFPSKAHAIHQQNSLASSTPAVDKKHVYCAWATPEEFTLVALSHDGRQAWRINLGTYVSRHGFGTSPILYQDLVIITGDSDTEAFVVAVEADSGKIRWKVPRRVHEEQNASYAAPCIYRPAHGAAQLIVCSWAHGISSFDPLSGKIHWEAAVLERRPVGSPIIVGELVLANCGEGGGNNAVVAVRPPAADQEPTVAYRIDKTSAPYVPTLVAKDELVFLWGDRGVVTCIDGASGKIHWRERVGGNYSSSPVRVADHIYGVAADGEVVCLAASAEFHVLGRSSLGEPSRATPAVAGERMFLRGDSRLVAVGK